MALPARSVCVILSLSILVACSLACALTPSPTSPAPLPATSDYREPSASLVRLLTASPPPTPLVDATSRQVALLYRQAVIRFERLAQPRRGLAGFRFDPATRTSGVEPLIERIEILRIDRGGAPPDYEWRPEEGAVFDHVSFSPDGQRLLALMISATGSKLAIFDVELGRARVLDVPVNPAWGPPCTWLDAQSLLCRLVPRGAGDLPAERIGPLTIERFDEPAPTRTYANLLQSPYADDLFEHYFSVELARVGTDGSVERLSVTPGLIQEIDPSPDGSLAVLKRIQRPFSRLVPASQFPSVVELWDLDSGARLYASRPSGFEVEAPQTGREDPRRAAWRPGSPTALGFIERTRGEDGSLQDRWMLIESSSEAGGAVELVRSERAIARFGWTTAGTPYYATGTGDGTGVEIFVVFEDGPSMIWSASTAKAFEDAGRAIRVDGEEGLVLESDGRIFLAGDGLGDEGPSPFLDVFDLRTRETRRVFSAEPGVFETVLAVLDPERLELLTSRETESEPPNLYLVHSGTRTSIRPFETPYPDLEGVTRQRVHYARADGVALSGSLYLPRGWKPGDPPLPTLVWIYPYEFTDREHAEQVDVRAFRFHQVKGPSPLAAVVSGYAVLMNPTVPILFEGGRVNDDYLEQLLSSAEAAVDHLVSIGVSAPGRIAVAGRSYGAFSAANLLIHSDRFATAIAMSGAYNRTLTPFGFQHEKRSFWDATAVYTSISPFFQADRVGSPLLLVHGGADENAGTPPLQARRFAHALIGQGAPVRYVELPEEGHHYWARESVLHAADEMIDWLDRTIGPATDSGQIHGLTPTTPQHLPGRRPLTPPAELAP